MTRFKKLQIMLLVLALVVLVVSTRAEVPQLINYQGRLTDNTGDPVPNAQYSIVFTIYDNTSTTVWQETHASVTTNDGLFNVLLGAGDHTGYGDLDESIFSDSVRWLGIKVGEDPEITPRTRLVSVPYTYLAQRADSADYARSADTATISLNSCSGYGLYEAESWTPPPETIQMNDIKIEFPITFADPSKVELSANITGYSGAFVGTPIIVTAFNIQPTYAILTLLGWDAVGGWIELGSGHEVMVSYTAVQR